MRGSPLKKILIVLLVFVVLGVIVKASSGMFGQEEKKITAKNTILQLELNGVILNGKKFLKNLEKYSKNSNVRAILININSPGGAVGPSQEIFNAIKTVRADSGKPVICVTTGVMASGAYYSAIACDKIVVAPGAMVGSIGVIMEFINLEKLYDWAKVSRLSITSGKFKDSGAEYRPMREEERALFQSMIDEVYQQFRTAVKTERKLTDEVMDGYADGRVFTGSTAVKMGFADQEGFFKDAVKLAASEAKLGEDFEIFEVPKKRMSIFDLGGSDQEDDVNALADSVSRFKGELSGLAVDAAVKRLLRVEFANQPLYMAPGYWE
jgi:protease-4